MNYGALWAARLQLLRPGNALMAALGVFVGNVLAGGFWTQWPALVAAFAITAFGNVLNDIRDVQTDRVNHPNRPLAAGTLHVSQAKLFAGFLLVLGLWEAFVVSNNTFLFATVNVLLLVAYETRLKRLGLIGNMTVATLVASTFAFGAVAAGAHPAEWGLLWALIATAWLTNLARELLKDVQDMTGDRDRRTFPQSMGAPPTLLVAFVLVNAAVILAAFAWFQAPGWWGVPLLAACLMFQFGGAAAWLDVRLAQAILKGAMLIAMAAFFWTASETIL